MAEGGSAEAGSAEEDWVAAGSAAETAAGSAVGSVAGWAAAEDAAAGWAAEDAVAGSAAGDAAEEGWNSTLMTRARPRRRSRSGCSTRYG